MLQGNYSTNISQFKVNESQYEQCGVTQHFSTGQNLLKKILRKNKNWHNQLRTVFSNGQNIFIKYWEKINTSTIIEKSFVRSAEHK